MWTFGGIRIYPQEFNQEDKQIIARLTPILSNTVHQIFGWEDPIVKVSAYIIGSGNRESIKAMTQDQSPHDLICTYGNVYASGNFFLNVFSSKMMNNVSQCIDTTQPEDAAVYIVDLELYQNV